MSSASIYLDQQELRGKQLRRYALTLTISILLHLLILALLAIWSDRVLPASDEQELFVPLSLEEPEQPPPPPVQQQPAPAEPSEPVKEQPQDKSLFGFEGTTEEEVDEPIRPPGPEELIHAPALPNPEGDLFGAKDILEDPGPVPPLQEEETTDEVPEPLKEPIPQAESAPEAQPETPREEIPEPEEFDPEPAPEEPGEEDGPESGATSVTPEPEDLDAPGESAGAPKRSKPRTPQDLPPRLPPSRPRPRRAPDLDFDVSGGSWGNHIRFDTMNDAEYSSKVYWAIYRAWLRELWNSRARFGRDQALYNLPMVDGKVAIHFVIHRDGTTDQLSVVTPSTMPTLDRASEAAILAAVLPQLPAGFSPDQEGVTFTFALIGFPSAMALERSLQHAKYRGEF